MVNSARLENESSRIHDDTSWEPSVDAITMMIAVANKLLVQPVMDFPSDKKLSPDWYGVSTEPTPSVDIVFDHRLTCVLKMLVHCFGLTLFVMEARACKLEE